MGVKQSDQWEALSLGEKVEHAKKAITQKMIEEVADRVRQRLISDRRTAQQ